MLSYRHLYPILHLLVGFSTSATKLVQAKSSFDGSELRRTLEGVDEDDDEYDGATDWNASSSDWYNLSTYVDPDSITYDLIQGFLFVALMAVVAWSCWSCGIRLGIWEDPRLHRYRHTRLVRDGRGVFSKIPAHLHEPDDAWDDDSQVSMEFGEVYDDNDEYEDEIDMQKEEKRLFAEAEGFFAAKDSRKTPTGQTSREPKEETDDILDLEADEGDQQKDKKQAETVFI